MASSEWESNEDLDNADIIDELSRCRDGESDFAAYVGLYDVS